MVGRALGNRVLLALKALLKPASWTILLYLLAGNLAGIFSFDRLGGFEGMEWPCPVEHFDGLLYFLTIILSWPIEQSAKRYYYAIESDSSKKLIRASLLPLTVLVSVP